MKRLFALLLAVLMVFSLVACTKAPAETTTKAPEQTTAAPAADETEAPAADETEAPAAEEAPEMTLDVLTGNTAGVMEGWLYDMIFEATNIHVNYLPTQDGNTEATVQQYMAEGKLPPLVKMNNQTLETAIQAGLLLPLDDYLDNKLCNIGYYFKEHVQAVRDLKSAGTGKFYGPGSMITPAYAVTQDYTGFQLRLDWWAELGYPHMANLDDLLNVLEQMIANHPTDENGDKNYGLILFAEWDGYTQAHYSQTARCLGFVNEGVVSYNWNEYVEGDMNTVKVSHILDKENSAYYDFCKFVFNCNQKGLLDPDSLTQTASDANENKVYNGRAAWQNSTWNTIWGAEREGEGIGFRFVGFDKDPNQKVVNTSGVVNVVNDEWLCVGAGHDDVTTDAALRLLNYCCDPLFLTSSQNGPYGKVWLLNEEGAPYVIESGVEMQNDQTAMLRDRGSNIWLTYGTHHVTPGLGGYSTDRWSWPQESWMPEKLKLDEMFESVYDGCVVYTDYINKEGRMVTPPAGMWNVVLSDDSQSLMKMMEADLKALPWELFYAADEAEFDAIWNAAVEKIEAMGVNSIVEEHKTKYFDFCNSIMPYIIDASEIPADYIEVSYK